MKQNILIIGGQGRIGQNVAQDLAQTSAQLILTSRKTHSEQIKNPSSTRLIQLDLSHMEALKTAIDQADLVIHCAGPFHQRDRQVLNCCIEQGVNYIDVSDSPEFTKKALAYGAKAQQAGVTAVINTGIFPGISNSLVRLAVEQLDSVNQIHLSNIVGGSGGAGLTVMRTTFLGLQHPFPAWIKGQWQMIQPYSDREVVQFRQPYGKVGVYWFNLPETLTLAESFPAPSVITKFGSFPDFYNVLTWIVTQGLLTRWQLHPQWIEFLAKISYGMTKITDRWSGIGVAIQAKVTGLLENKPTQISAMVSYEDTAKIAGMGTGMIAELILNGALKQPGVWPVERILPTALFQQEMANRGVTITLNSSAAGQK